MNTYQPCYAWSLATSRYFHVYPNHMFAWRNVRQIPAGFVRSLCCPSKYRRRPAPMIPMRTSFIVCDQQYLASWIIITTNSTAYILFVCCLSEMIDYSDQKSAMKRRIQQLTPLTAFFTIRISSMSITAYIRLFWALPTPAWPFIFVSLSFNHKTVAIK